MKECEHRLWKDFLKHWFYLFVVMMVGVVIGHWSVTTSPARSGAGSWDHVIWHYAETNRLIWYNVKDYQDLTNADNRHAYAETNTERGVAYQSATTPSYIYSNTIFTGENKEVFHGWHAYGITGDGRLYGQLGALKHLLNADGQIKSKGYHDFVYEGGILYGTLGSTREVVRFER